MALLGIVEQLRLRRLAIAVGCLAAFGATRAGLLPTFDTGVLGLHVAPWCLLAGCGGFVAALLFVDRPCMSFLDKLCIRQCPEHPLMLDDCPACCEKRRGLHLLDTYVELREGDEAFIDTYRRVGMNPFKERVYGTA